MLAIPQTPKLWTPRRGRWWRLPRFDVLNMAHIKKSASTGHLLKTATGHLTKGCSSPTDLCYCSGETCRLVITGVTSYTTCTYYDPYYKKVSSDINGTYDVPFTSSGFPNCNYQLTTSLTTGRYFDASCSSAVEEAIAVLSVVVNYISGQINISFTGASTTLFSNASSTTVDDCVTGTTVPNETSDFGTTVGYDGDAVVTFF